MTHDIDLAAAACISVVLPAAGADVPGVLEGLEMAFLPGPQGVGPAHAPALQRGG
jgi:hypothetical protein